MSHVDKIQICGIRSFNPRVDARQTVVFQRPLTIILGKNGCGKTTLIESLLNATTGQMPPGATAPSERSGFIYDPKIAGETEVKGQIRLSFTTRAGQEMQVIRSFAATQSRTGAGNNKFQTLDSTIAFRDEANNKISSSSYRAGDVDQMVPELLGVTRAVLEHVIFCHQEDCNWPLGSSSDVKKRFDELFASTRYVAALDKLREKNKEYRAEQKQIETALSTMREQREQAKTIREEIKSKEETVQQFAARVSAIKPQLVFFETVVKAIEGARRDSDDLQRENAVLRGRIQEMDNALAKYSVARVANTRAELEATLAETEKARVEVEAAVRELQKRQDALVARQREQEKVVHERRADVRVAESGRDEHARRVQELQAIVDGLPADLRPPQQHAGAGADAEQLGRVEQQLQQRLAEVRQAAAAAASELQQLTERAAAERAQLDRDMHAGATERALKDSHARDAQRKATALRARIPAGDAVTHDAVEAARGAVAEVRGRIAELERRVQAGGAAQQREEAQREAESLAQRIAAVTREAHELRDDQRVYAGVRDGLADQQTKKATADDHLRRRVLEPLAAGGAALPQHDHGAQVKALLAAPLTSQTAREAEKIAAAVKRSADVDATGADDERRDADAQLSRAERQLEDARAALAKAARELEDKNAALSKESLGGRSAAEQLESALAAEEERLRRVVTDLTSKRASLECFQEYINVAQRESKCSVCERDFDGDEASQFINAKTRELASTPDEIKELDNARRRREERIAALRRLQPAAMRAAELSGTTIPEAQAAVDRHGAAVQALRQRVEASAAAHTAAQKALREAADILAAAQRAVQLFNDYDVSMQRYGLGTLSAAAKKKLLAALGVAGAPTAEQVAALLKAMEADTKRREADAAALQEQLHAAQRRVQAAGNEKQVLETELLQKDNRLMQLETAFTQRRALVADAEAAEREAEAADARIKELDVQHKEFQRRLAELSKQSAAAGSRQAELAQRRTQLVTQEQTLQRSAAALSAGLASLQRGANRGANNNSNGAVNYEAAREAEKAAIALLAQIEEEAQTTRGELDTKRKGVGKLEEQRDKIKRHIGFLLQKEERDGLEARFKANEAKVKAAVEYASSDAFKKAQEAVMQTCGTAENRESLLAAVQDMGGALRRHGTVEAIMDACRQEVETKAKHRAQFEGQASQIQQDLRDRRAQLENDKYREIDKRYTTCFVRYQSLDIAIADVDKFYKALERAVSSYHQEKIAQINRMIAELWRATYRGSDIDTIEVKSEDDDAAGASTSTTARRSYKYRVVMKRGGMELDMRGRCSAGQKVLASVIIRLALSEAFCCECGILALDEPTTNLDAENAKSLAQALHNIIEVRRDAMQHFQLIVITHDNEFVRCLGARGTDKIFCVDKDKEGAFSIITEKTYDQIFTS